MIRCLNHLHFPAGITQSVHSHPSIRLGVVATGRGVAYGPGEGAPWEEPLDAGCVFLLESHEFHAFRTTAEVMNVIAYHPDSDWGPTDGVHPMLNRTYFAAELPNESPGGATLWVEVGGAFGSGWSIYDPDARVEHSYMENFAMRCITSLIRLGVLSVSGFAVMTAARRAATRAVAVRVEPVPAAAARTPAAGARAPAAVAAVAAVASAAAARETLAATGRRDAPRARARRVTRARRRPKG